jgi:CRP-like cAMP-binding protein
MNIDSLIDHLSTMVNVSSAFQEAVKAGMKSEFYKARQIIHSAGQIENRLWFIESGFVRTYYFDSSGKEHTLKFYSDKDMIFSYQGFYQEASDYYIDVVSPSAMLSLTYERFASLIQNFVEAKTITQIFTRQYHHQELFKSRLMTLAAEERYYQFRKAQPGIFKKASVRIIASYLNMTRENLSRLITKDM